MFDGKTFLPVTGIPIRKIACINNELALAEPVPLTVPIRKAKSFIEEDKRLLGASDNGPLASLAALALGWFMLLPSRVWRASIGQNQPCPSGPAPRTESGDRTASCPTPRSGTVRRTDHNGDTR